MKNVLTLLSAVALLFFVAISCKDDATGELKIALPSIAVTVPGLTITDNVVTVPVTKDSTLAIHYVIGAENGIQEFLQKLNGVEEVIEVAGEGEVTGEVIVNLPFDDVTIEMNLELKDVNDQVVTTSLAIVVVPVTVGPIHGTLRQIVVAGAGTKADNNVNNYTFAGHRHMHHRFTDFENAATTVPGSDTKAGWQSLLDGIFPSTVATDFNNDAAADGCTVHLEGGPTVSGKYLQRVDRPNGLPTFNLFALSPTVRTPKVFMSSYIRSVTDINAGKVLRMYWRLYNEDGTTKENRNLYPTKPVGDQLTWRCEGNFGIGWADQRLPSATGWNRIDMMVDFDEGKYALMLNGEILTDVSNNYNGWVYDQVGDGYLHYALLGNTIIPNGEPDAALQFAQPVADWDVRRIEIADSDDWDTKTRSVIQPVKSWASDNIEFIINQGDFDDLTDKHIFYVDGLDATYIGAL